MNDETRIAFAHYGAVADVSGVTTWLQGLIPATRRMQMDPSLLIHILGEKAIQLDKSSVAQALSQCDIQIESSPGFPFTEDAVANSIGFLNRHQPACFLPQCLAGFHFAAQFAGVRGLPWVFTLHSDDPEYWGLAEECAPTVDQGAWVAVSEHIAGEATRRFPHADIRTIPYGVAIPVQSAEYRQSPFRVVFSGRLVEQQKRIRLVIQTLILACRQASNVEAVILGHGPDRVEMQQIVTDAGLGERIKFRGRVAPDLIQNELRQAQAILLMSDFEGLPVALLEGMAAGLVPIARAIPSGIPELVIPGQTGVLVGDDPSRAAAAIVSIAGNADLWQQLSKGARQHATDFYSQEICFAKWRDLIQELTARCTIKYPLLLPRKVRLPPPNPALSRLDHRRQTMVQQFRTSLRHSVRRIARRVRSAIAPTPE